MIEREFVHCAVPYRRTVKTLASEQELAGVTYQASVWIGNGTALNVLTITDLKPGEILPPHPTIVYVGG